jgi:hypothetical protein
LSVSAVGSRTAPLAVLVNDGNQDNDEGEKAHEIDVWLGLRRTGQPQYDAVDPFDKKRSGEEEKEAVTGDFPEPQKKEADDQRCHGNGAQQHLIHFVTSLRRFILSSHSASHMMP